MAYPKVSKQQRRTGIGLSIDAEMVSQIDALSGGTGRRSTFIRELLVDGLEQRYGPNWREVAAAMSTESEPTESERAA